MNLIRRLLCSTAALALACVAHAQSYPAKPVKIIVPYAAGQGTDVAVRFVASKLAERLGQAFVVDNRPGAAGNIGMELGARAAPDGYTLVVGAAGTLAMNPYLYSALPFDPEKDFEPIILIALLPMVIVADPALPIGSLQELITYAKSRPNGVNTGLPSTSALMVCELLKQNGVPLFNINYKSSATALAEVMGGQLQVAIDTVIAARPLITSGKLKALAVSTKKRSEMLPGVATVAEQGLPGFEVSAWIGFYAPKGTPRAIIDALNAEARTIIAQPETRTHLLQLGFEAAGGAPQELAEFGRAEREKWSRVIKAANIKAE